MSKLGVFPSEQKMDFANKPEIIEESFSRYYRTTILSGETDPNKLYDLVATMEGYQVYSDNDVERLVNLYLNGADRDKLDPILDACTVIYKYLEMDDQIKFKSAAKAFVRTYGFLGAILPYGNADWERLSIFLNLLIPKLPSPREDDLSQGILEIPAMVSRNEKYQNAMKNSDEQSARLESERALQQVIFAIMADNMELFKQFQDNLPFKKWLSDLVFNLTYNKEGEPYEAPPQKHKSVVYNFEPQQEMQMVAEEQLPYEEKNE